MSLDIQSQPSKIDSRCRSKDVVALWSLGLKFPKQDSQLRGRKKSRGGRDGKRTVEKEETPCQRETLGRNP
ncbi:hypothetical protein SLE2022_170140 [Rubroshorea leprosula]